MEVQKCNLFDVFSKPLNILVLFSVLIFLLKQTCHAAGLFKWNDFIWFKKVNSVKILLLNLE